MKRSIFAAVVAFGCTYAHAQDEPRFDDQRLFTTEAQREHLDALREGTPPKRSANNRRERSVPVPEKPQAKEAEPVRLQGFVRRGDGRSAIWANGDSTLDGSLSGEFSVDPARIRGSTVVVTLGGGEDVLLKPGQVWSPDGRRVVDGYQIASDEDGRRAGAREKSAAVVVERDLAEREPRHLKEAYDRFLEARKEYLGVELRTSEDYRVAAMRRAVMMSAARILGRAGKSKRQMEQLYQQLSETGGRLAAAPANTPGDLSGASQLKNALKATEIALGLN